MAAYSGDKRISSSRPSAPKQNWNCHFYCASLFVEIETDNTFVGDILMYVVSIYDYALDFLLSHIYLSLSHQAHRRRRAMLLVDPLVVTRPIPQIEK